MNTYTIDTGAYSEIPAPIHDYPDIFAARNAHAPGLAVGPISWGYTCHILHGLKYTASQDHGWAIRTVGHRPTLAFLGLS
jgi:hypothetical protein